MWAEVVGKYASRQASSRVGGMPAPALAFPLPSCLPACPPACQQACLPPAPRTPLHRLRPPLQRHSTSSGLPQHSAISDARRLRGSPRMLPSSSAYRLTPTKPLSCALDSRAMFSTCNGEGRQGGRLEGVVGRGGGFGE